MNRKKFGDENEIITPQNAGSALSGLLSSR